MFAFESFLHEPMDIFVKSFLLLKTMLDGSRILMTVTAYYLEIDYNI